MSPQLLITGANGFTGQHACKHFTDLGYDIIATTRNKTLIGDKNVKIVQCELTNKNEVNVLIKKVKPDFLLHLAGQNHTANSWRDPISTLEANMLSTAYLIDAIRQEQPYCKMLIVGSALQFDPTNFSTLLHPYSLSKTLQVQVAQAWQTLYKLNIVVAKPSNLIGPGPSNGVISIFASNIAEMEKKRLEDVLTVNNLNTRRDFLDVRDAVCAYEIILNKGESGEVYEVNSGKSHSLGEIIQKYKKLTTVDFKVKSLSNDEDEQFKEVDPLKLLQLDWRSKFSIDTSLKDTLSYFRYHVNVNETLKRNLKS